MIEDSKFDIELNKVEDCEFGYLAAAWRCASPKTQEAFLADFDLRRKTQDEINEEIWARCDQEDEAAKSS